jgi:NAD(P)-dependent dehydrogenase (short-subunit alcohol dehydrogenase family)
MVFERKGRQASAVIRCSVYTYCASAVPEGVLRAIFDVNFFGTVALTQALLPLIRRSAAGRIVNVSSKRSSLKEMSGKHRRGLLSIRRRRLDGNCQFIGIAA